MRVRRSAFMGMGTARCRLLPGGRQDEDGVDGDRYADQQHDLDGDALRILWSGVVVRHGIPLEMVVKEKR
jgi:hypothetical protein